MHYLLDKNSQNLNDEDENTNEDLLLIFKYYPV
jgi:hypothetical protein